MIRVLLINALLFLLPFALTYVWVRFIAAKNPTNKPANITLLPRLRGWPLWLPAC